ncbi:hypothetical protein [Planctomycetes bacterium TBK1r]|uniref:hypothetical protein n=1 Tax=Stieleria magnilauensis TaxID=2527963 RepID=UPI0011A4E947
MDTIYIGYDPREHVAVRVLMESIERHASRPINVVTLNVMGLRRSGLYRRTPHVDSTCWGNPPSKDMVDAFDGRPFSTDFSFTRFLVPFLNQLEGFAVFMDCDMYFRKDPCLLFDEFAKQDGPAIHCVQHQYDGGGQERKMYGCLQTSYSRKNWSSFVLYNCGHPAHHMLTVDDVNTKPGRWLHNFQWLPDDEIGALPDQWNWLDGHSDESTDPANVHFTTGGPWFGEEAGLGYDTWKPKREIDARYSQEWLELAREFAVLPTPAETQ